MKRWVYLRIAFYVVCGLIAASFIVHAEPVLRWGFIDKAGNVVIKPQFGSAAEFFEGLAAVQFPSYGKWGFIDKAGQTVIEPQFLSPGFNHWSGSGIGFSEGLAAV